MKDKSKISDGYHTFEELYNHRVALYIALCTLMKKKAWKSKKHDDGTAFDGWFIMGLELEAGAITYHLPNKHWDELDHIETLENGKPWDGHTSSDVVDRLLNTFLTDWRDE